MLRRKDIYSYEIQTETVVEAGVSAKLEPILSENPITAELRKFLVFVDKNLYMRQKDDIERIVLGLGRNYEVEVIDSGELVKTMAGAEMIYQICAKHSIKRDCGIIAIAGGTICDVLGFVCATYMRGIPMISIPTTLMSASDAIIGKVGVNYLMHKNLIGAWFTPAITIIDTDLLAGNTPQHIAVGLAEIIKAALIDGKESVRELGEDVGKLLSRDVATLEKYIELSLRVKAGSVKGDEKDTLGHHARLSLGHTLADVIETVSPFGFVTHGESVALGMIFAARVNEILEGSSLSKEILEKTIALVKAAGLPVKLPVKISDNELVEGLLNSKKSRHDKITLLLVKNYGDVRVVEGISAETVKDALKFII